ncbi:DUF2812 domain-containing protein [Sedimentibacter sp. zth1]|uniref:DUF2812 domain-containing protein n=1 Tax=Sedimentibacter sp. zth1 TaxID=2816908 RepID=UPI001A911827|nr:DUF2812 domain-containing protein [Sedimentibacter sp. zth1]QSX06910.1 DUF2812 domain-containing protein [Sedimentibacter sp. zth1]
MKSYIYIVPFNQYDMCSLVLWLNKKAENGLILNSIGNNFARFSNSEYEKIRYYIEPYIENDEDNIVEDYNNKYSNYGLEYITSSKHFRIYYSKSKNYSIGSFSKNNIEILSDKLVEVIKTIKNTIKVSVILAIIYIILYIGTIGSFINFIQNNYIFCILALLFSSLSLFNSKYDYNSLLNSIEFCSYTALYGNNKIKNVNIKRIIKFTLVLLLNILVLIVSLKDIDMHQHKHIEDLECMQVFTELINIENNENNMYFDTVDVYKKVLSPKYYKIYEYAEYGVIELEIEYYELLFPQLTNILIEDYISTIKYFNVDRKNSAKIFNKKNEVKFDIKENMVYAKLHEYQFLLIYKDNKALYIQYKGHEDLKSHARNILKDI